MDTWALSMLLRRGCDRALKRRCEAVHIQGNAVDSALLPCLHTAIQLNAANPIHFPLKTNAKSYSLSERSALASDRGSNLVCRCNFGE